MQPRRDGNAPAFSGQRIWQEPTPELDASRPLRREPVAIIGIGCRFPGASGPEAFWRLICNGDDAITEIPADRFDIDAYYDPKPGRPGKIITRRGGFIEQVDQFDPQFFGISPREAACMDPQQRLLLEVAWEALEDAGQIPADLAKSQTGVFIGMCAGDYGDMQYHYGDPADLDVYSVPGGARSILSGRLSYALNLQGPSVSIDTACSSSLVALHFACESIWRGECTTALVGGVNLILMPETFMCFSLARMLSPDGRCKAFDARADGFVRSEGAGVIVLKPLSLAESSGDPIYAVIRGSAANNDGRSSGMMMPSREAQEEVVRAACRSAAVSPGRIHYVEAHGTGTGVGDPIEALALGTVLAEGRPEDSPCIIGSVKTNIGHLEGAAGVAGVIKAALCLKHRMIPPTLHFQEPNPNIPWENLPLVVQRDLGPWPAEAGPGLAGVSSFGISGTNVHVILEEAPTTSQVREQEPAELAAPCLLPLSGHTRQALEDLARAYRAFVATEREEPGLSLRDLCYTASARRSHHAHRLALVAHSGREVAEQLEAFLQGEARPSLSSGVTNPSDRHKLVFVFSGQGPQWWPLDRALLEREPVFRATIERCDNLLRRYVDWSLLEELTAGDEQSRLSDTEMNQPAIFATQVALAALWRSWGIEPDAVVGHSIGEVAAAHVAGALTLEDAVRVIYHRSRLAKRAVGQGKMALVALSLEEARQAIGAHEDRLSIAVNSSPTSTVLSGDPAALAEVLASLEQRNVFCRLLPAIDYAAHSPQMEPLTGELVQSLDGLQPRPPSLPIYSTVTGAASDGLLFDAHYWARNLREPVLLSTTIGGLIESGHDVFLEIHPQPVLPRSIEEALRHAGRAGTVLSSLKRGEEGRAAMLASLGTLHTLGYTVSWRALYPSGGRCVALPAYPWSRERYWIDPREMGDGRSWRRSRGPKGGHPLLDRHVTSAAHAGTHLWEIELGLRPVPWLADHRVQGSIVFPAAAYAEIALAAAGEAFGEGPHQVEKVSFKKALFLPEDGLLTAQLVLAPEMPGAVSFQFFSRQDGGAESREAWTLHAAGTVRLGQKDEPVAATPHSSLAEIQAQCVEAVSGVDHYQAMEARGLEYGPSFQGVEQIWRRDGEALGQLRLPESVVPGAGAYRVHPALLDACFQLLAAGVPREAAGAGGGETYLPVALERLQIYGRPHDGCWAHSLFRASPDLHAGTLEGDLFLLDGEGRVVLEALGLRLQRLGLAARGLAAENLDDWLYEVQWQVQARQEDEPAPEPSSPGSWLIFADAGGVGKALADLLNARGERCVLIRPGEALRRTFRRAGREYFRANPARPDEMRQLLDAAMPAGQPPWRGIVHLWSLNGPHAEEESLAALEAAQTPGCASVLHLVQGLALDARSGSPRLWVVTRGMQPAGALARPVAVAHAPLWGLGRVIATEHPELHCTTIDLGPAADAREAETLFRELWLGGGEDQIALRGDGRYVARLVRRAPDTSAERRRPAGEGEPFRLETSTPGILDHLTLRATTRPKPGPGEVEIEVYATGLNFLDVLSAMGIRPDQPDGPILFGMECAGKIAALGEGVEGVQVGDEVVAIAPASFAAYARTMAPFVVPKPAHLSFEEAATIPVAFLTAYYALEYLGRLRQGERVLIHAAAGGVGLAAVRLAQRAGAEIFATAGNPEKREFLRSLGVEHVMDSRSLAFADEVMERTNGEGVDLVLNSLAGEFIPRSLSTLRANGRFLEIGKRDIYQNSQLSMGYFRKNIAFFAVDLIPMFTERSDLCAVMLRELAHSFEDGTLKPLEHRVFPVSEVESAFRYMAQARHIGKIVVSMRERELLIAPASDGSAVVRPDGSYLVTGGLGGLGLSVAAWMVEQGARHLVLIGRSAPSPSALEVLEAMRESGAEVVVAAADVTREDDVASLVATIRRTMPPLRGIVHAAGVLDDGVLLQMSQERFRTVMAPKMNGAWILHRLTLHEPLDFFILFSSVASVLGSPGQGNYVAANAFLDALAHHRRALGLPALAINWGAWAEVGLAARPDRVRHLEQQGIVPFTPDQGVQLLQRTMRHDVAQVMALSVDWSRLLGSYRPPLLSQLAEQIATRTGPAKSSGRKAGLTREMLLAAEPEERRRLVEAFLREEIAAVLRSPADKLDVHQPLDQLGIDSLMAYEFKNRVEADLELAIPVALLLQGPSLAQLTTVLLEQLVPESVAPPPPPVAEQAPEQLLSQVAQLSDQEVDTLLHQLIEEEEGEGRQPVEEIRL